MSDYKALMEAVLNGDIKTAVDETQKAIDAKDNARDVLDKGLIPAMDEMGDRFSAGFAKLMEKYGDVLIEVRQKGLMIGLKHKQESHGFIMTNLMFKNGVIALFANNDKSVLQIMPPLIINESEVDEVIEALERSYDKLAGF